MIRLAALLCLLCAPVAAQEHDLTAPGHWYELACCSQRDCAPIRQEWVHTTPKGYFLRIPPGGHPMLTGSDVWQSQVIEFDRAKQSQDTEFHACIRPDGWLLCLYAPFMGG